MPGRQTVARRDWFLANLGVVRYVARQASALDVEDDQGAPASPGDDPPNASSSPRAPAAKPPGPRRSRIDLDALAPVKSPTSPAAVTASAAVTDKSPPATAPLQCRFGFWQPAGRVAVLSAMPPGQRPTPPQTTMLANLLKAIGALGEELPAVDLIDWPLSAGLALAVGTEVAAAQEYLSIFIQAKCRLQPFDTLLLMGDIAAQLGAGEGGAAGDETLVVGAQLSLAGGIRGIVTHSLYAMDNTPSLKAETWQAIRFLADSNRP